MPLTLYNSLGRRKEAFQPIDPKNVRMYVCGPTVYDRAHIGNGRAFVVFDVLYRLLRDTYGRDHVRYVRNITDVDDKIIDAARGNGEPIAALTERTIAAFHEDMAALGVLPPDVEPRATGHIAPMIAMIERLVAAGHAYVVEGNAGAGHVLFAVASDPGYGQLSGRSRDEMIAGARVEVAPYKRDPADFVLWKPSSADQPGWDSPWGRGRPGWHIECSAMSEAHLGETFDIHGGGIDLIFPHHENEIAQSTRAHAGRPFARYWLHNEFLSIDSAKMSKSLGNFFTVRDLLDTAPGEVIRLALLSAHYRDPLDWTSERLRQARASLDRWYRALAEPSSLSHDDSRQLQAAAKGVATPPPLQVVGALEDDLNTPLAIKTLHDIAGAIYRSQDGLDRRRLQIDLQKGAGLLGLLRHTPLEWLTAGASLSEAIIQMRITERAEARRDRDFAKADRIRSALAALGILLEDHPDGTTTWHKE